MVALTILIFLTVSLGIVAGFFAVSGLIFRDAAVVRQRVDEEFRQKRDPAAASPLFKNVDRLSLADLPPPPDRQTQELVFPPADTSLQARLTAMLEQANLPYTPRQLVTVAAAAGLLAGAVATWLFGPLIGAAAAAAAAAAPLVHVHLRRRARCEKLQAQLPNAFDLMARVIRGGQSVPQALQAVADTSPDPIASEFTTCQRRQNLGMRPEVAFHEMAQRSGALEIRIFVMALLIQRQTGGNLSEVLERLASLIRERQRLRRRVLALTAEGRLQGLTLLVLPFVVFAAMMVINRPYAEVLLKRVPLLAFTGTSMALGALWIRKIVNFKP